MTFGDDDRDDENETLDRLHKAMEILKATCISAVPDHELPDGFADRLGMLFAGIAKLALSGAEFRNQEQGLEDDDEINAFLNSMMNDMIKCAIVVAIKFAKEEYADTLPSFSRN